MEETIEDVITQYTPLPPAEILLEPPLSLLYEEPILATPPLKEPTPLAEIPHLTLQDLIEIANRRSHDLIRPDYTRLYELTYARRPQTIDPWYFDGHPRMAYISSRDAMADVTDLITLLSQFYGAYIYFGGDSVFFEVKEQLGNLLHTQELWDTDNFAYHLREYLSTVIRDSHFRVDSDPLWASYNFMIPTNPVSLTVFERSEAGIRNRTKELYVAQVIVDGKYIDIEDAFRHSLGEDGELYYSFVVVLPDNIPTPATATVVYTTGVQFTFSISPLCPPRLEARDVSMEYISDFPVVTITQMGFPDSTYGMDFAGARQFLSYAEALRDEPIIIVDIRANRGGNGRLAPRFLHILTGEVIPRNHYGLRVWDYDDFRRMAPPYANLFHLAPESEIYAPSRRFDSNHILIHTSPFQVIQNDTLIILLVDRHTYSAGDGFADIMFSMENTLVIGQNTGGMLHTDLSFTNMSLPRSGVSVDFGTTIFIHPEGHLPEGVGIAPDLWVNGDALTATLALLAAEGLPR